MKYIFAVATIAFCLTAEPEFLSDAHAQEADLTCDALEECIELFLTHELHGPEERVLYYGGAFSSIEAQIVAYGDPGIPLLVDRLAIDHIEARSRIIHILNEYDQIGDEFLDDLIGFREEDWYWNEHGITWLIGDMGTPRAVEYLKSEFLEDPTSISNEGVSSALAKLRSDIAPFLLEQIRCESDCSVALVTGAGDVFLDMGWIPENAIDPLLEMSRDSSLDPISRGVARSLVATIHPPTPESVAVISEDLVRHSRYSRQQTLWQLASYGDAAKSAGDRILEVFMGEVDPDVRNAASYTLGAIGYEPAIGALVAELNSGDWMGVYIAIESLAKLDANSSAPQIRRLRDNHWSRPVRTAAQRALDHFEAPSDQYDGIREQPLFWARLREDDRGHCRNDFVTFRGEQYEIPSSWAIQHYVGNMESAVIREMIGGLSDDRPIGSYLRVGGGWLVGTTNGEWGGALFFVSNDFEEHLLVSENNVSSIVQTNNRIVVLTGMGHLSINEGGAWEISQSGNGQWEAIHIGRLPAAPGGTLVLDDGTILVMSGGAVAITDEGFERVDCEIVDDRW